MEVMTDSVTAAKDAASHVAEVTLGQLLVNTARSLVRIPNAFNRAAVSIHIRFGTCRR